MSAAPVLSVQGLVKRYAPDQTALAGVDVTARSGEIVGLLRANGARKTTLVGLIHRMSVSLDCLRAAASEFRAYARPDPGTARRRHRTDGVQ
jgi:ABC-type Na+ transport system ATPase subunit NatA